MYMTNYLKKYQKYKAKYLRLKMQSGGAMLDNPYEELSKGVKEDASKLKTNIDTFTAEVNDLVKSNDKEKLKTIQQKVNLSSLSSLNTYITNGLLSAGQARLIRPAITDANNKLTSRINQL